jgi:predicted  nucleic acid-binding Zn-ribbon protein
MLRCDRCGMGFGPIQAAVLEFCPRCRSRDYVSVPLIARWSEDSESGGGVERRRLAPDAPRGEDRQNG